MTAHRRWWAPEVVQTSAMDCGPAALKCLLEGHGIGASYGRLREACQTRVDGTSIDTLEDVAQQLGLDATQVVLPVDHVLPPGAESLPALAVQERPDGVLHFVVAWSRSFGRVQVMDPAQGRRWVPEAAFLGSLHRHRMVLPAEAWRDWMASDAFLEVLGGRLRRLGLAERVAETQLAEALQDPTWWTLSCLDAATRMTAALVGAGAIRRGDEAGRIVVSALARRGPRPTHGGPAFGAPLGGMDPQDWVVWPAGEANGQTLLVYEGAVLLHVAGRQEEVSDGELTGGLLPEELVAALAEPAPRPFRDLLALVDGTWRGPAAWIVASTAVEAAGAVLLAVGLRALFDLVRLLAPVEQRLGALAAAVGLVWVLMMLRASSAHQEAALGRQLELSLRAAFLAKLPRMPDRWFHSRLVSDMAERAHSVHLVRTLPSLGTALAHGAFSLAFTLAGIAWLDRGALPLVALAGAVNVGVALGLDRVLTEPELRMRSHLGGLSRQYLDAMLGLVPIRTHGAERAVRREQEGLLTDWVAAGLDFGRARAGGLALQQLVGVGLTAGILFDHVRRAPDAGAVLLLVYWALSVAEQGRTLAGVVQQLPSQRNAILRALEPLGAPEDRVPEGTPVRTGPAELRLAGVGVVAAGHRILDGVDLEVPAGSEVAVVGPSGAGKSTLVGLLLGWHQAAEGHVEVDGRPLDAEELQALRRRTVWVDPEVQLWNRSLLDNLVYGNDDDAVSRVAEALEQAALHDVLERVPEGLQTALGEGGGLLSGGQGQRVRLGRGLLRRDPSLVLLDEPFRGLDRATRRRLLGELRSTWAAATLVCVTHDVGDVADFERVVVVDGGRIVEDGVPAELLADEGSHYARLVASEAEVRHSAWGGEGWRRVVLDDGQAVDA